MIRKYFMINLHESYLDKLGLELKTPRFAIRWATELCRNELNTNIYVKTDKVIVINRLSSDNDTTVFESLLTHLPHVDSSTTILWTILFKIVGCLVSFYYYNVLQKFLNQNQKV